MLQTSLEGERADLVFSSRRNDPDYAEVLPFFVESLPEARTALMEFAKVCDYEGVRREAHRMRGTAGGYGYEGLSDLAGRLEDTCKSSGRDAAAILRDLETLIGYLERVR